MQQENYLAIWYFFHGLIENTNIPYTNNTCFDKDIHKEHN